MYKYDAAWGKSYPRLFFVCSLKTVFCCNFRTIMLPARSHFPGSRMSPSGHLLLGDRAGASDHSPGPLHLYISISWVETSSTFHGFLLRLVLRAQVVLPSLFKSGGVTLLQASCCLGEVVPPGCVMDVSNPSVSVLVGPACCLQEVRSPGQE